MRPYLAVIWDSLEEAIRARTLWILLTCWTLILIAISPVGIVNEASYRFNSDEIVRGRKDTFATQLVTAAKGKGTEAQNLVVASLKESTREELKSRDAAKGLNNGRIAELLNEALDAPDLYKEEAWPKAKNRSELESLIEAKSGQRSREQREHLNRRLVEMAFPGMVNGANDSGSHVTYAGMKVTQRFPLDATELKKIVEIFGIQVVMKVGLGIIAMFIAVVITSAMIPDMFQAGSLHLLLSKPISRSLLYLSKFIGGCSFVALNIAYLLIGLFIVVGLRLEIWNTGILLCIPVFIFIFMIFYSVSAFAGLVWKNPIICVVVTILFWAVCFVVGAARAIMTPFVEEFPRVVAIKPIKNEIIAAQMDSSMVVWDPKTSTWQRAFGTNLSDGAVVGPYWLPEQGELYFGRAFRSAFGVEVDNARMSIAKLPELASPSTEKTAPSKAEDKDKESNEDGDVPSEDATTTSESAESNETPEAIEAEQNSKSEKKAPSSKKKNPKSQETRTLWSDARSDSGSNLPPQTQRIIEWKGTVMALTDSGLFRYDPTAAKPKANGQTGLAGMFDAALKNIVPVQAEAYRSVTDPSWQPKSPMDFCTDPTGRIIVYSQGKLELMEQNEKGIFDVVKEQTVFENTKLVALVASNKEGVLVVSDKDKCEWRSLTEMDKAKTVEFPKPFTPRRVIASRKDGKFAVLTSKGDLWIVSADGGSASHPALKGQGNVNAIAFNEQGNLLVAHTTNQIDQWDIDGTNSKGIVRPSLGTLGWIFYRIINPIYIVNPKPTSVNDTITYCLTKEDRKVSNKTTTDLSREQLKLDPWTPLWSNAIFIIVILGAGCWYLHRQDL